MEQLPYYLPPEQPAWKRNLEGLIPILLIAIIGVVVLGKMTSTFCGLPVMGSVLCNKPQITIAVIGDLQSETPLLERTLDGPNAKSNNIYYVTFDPTILTYAKERLLGKYDLVIVTGDTAKDITRPIRDGIGTYVENGGKLILIKSAATTDPDDPLILGWGAGRLGNVFPVKLSSDSEKTVSDVSLYLVEIDHPIIRSAGYLPEVSLTTKGIDSACHDPKVADVVPWNNGNAIAYLQSSTDRKVTVPAIIEGSSLLGGKILYFAYDPGCTENLAISSLLYMAGKI